MQNEPNFVVTQINAKVPFTLDVVFESESFIDREKSLAGEFYTEMLQWHQTRFNQRFDKTFNLKEKGFVFFFVLIKKKINVLLLRYSGKEIKFAQAALSNMIGGIGYFYGTSRVQSYYTKEPVPYWKAALYTAVPSRLVITK